MFLFPKAFLIAHLVEEIPIKKHVFDSGNFEIFILFIFRHTKKKTLEVKN